MRGLFGLVSGRRLFKGTFEGGVKVLMMMWPSTIWGVAAAVSMLPAGLGPAPGIIRLLSAERDWEGCKEGFERLCFFFDSNSEKME